MAEMGYGTWMFLRLVEKHTEAPLTRNQKTITRSCTGDSGTNFSLTYFVTGIYANKYGGRKVRGTVANHPIKITDPGNISSGYGQLNYISTHELTLSMKTNFGSDNLPYLTGTATLRKNNETYTRQVTCR